MKIIFDIETDDLNASKIWCIVAKEIKGNFYKFGPDKLDDALELLASADTLIGHNIISFDLPVLKRLYGFRYSGKIIDKNHLEKNINSKPKVLLMHGDKDEIVPVSSLLEAKEFFNKIDYKIQTKIFKNCEHRIPQEGSSMGLEFLKTNLY